MKQKHETQVRAFTRIELAVITAIVALLGAMLLPALAQSRQTTQSLMCMNNLKIIGVAYRVWAAAHGGRAPAQQIMQKGGWQDLNGGGLYGPGVSSDICGPACFTNYEIMQNELGQSPRIVLCPSDERMANTNFYDPHWSAPGFPAGKGTFGNTNCSYWVGVGANAEYPQSLLGGDRNMGAGAPATAFANQDPNYGFSPEAGRTIGADVQLSTNGQILSGAGGGSLGYGTYCQWAAKMHSGANDLRPVFSEGSGNVLFGDGSVSQLTSPAFRASLRKAADLGNYGPTNPAQPNVVRLVFP